MPATKNATHDAFFVYGGYSWRMGMGVLGMEGKGSRLVREGGCRRYHRRFRRVGDVMERRGESESPWPSRSPPSRVLMRQGGIVGTGEAEQKKRALCGVFFLFGG